MLSTINTETIKVATIATKNEIDHYNNDILDTIGNDDNNNDNIIDIIPENNELDTALRNNYQNFLYVKKNLKDTFIILFIINLIYNIFNIFNIILFIPLFYNLFVILKPDVTKLKSIPYINLLTLIVNVFININMSLTIYSIYIYNNFTYNTVINLIVITYISMVYLLSIINSLIYGVLIKEFLLYKTFYNNLIQIENSNRELINV